MAKDFVIVKGKVVKMNDAAFQLASKHFGATKNRPAQRAVPIELLKMPKLPIIPAKKVEVVSLPKEELKVIPAVVDIPDVKAPGGETIEVNVPLAETRAATSRTKSTAKKRKR